MDNSSTPLADYFWIAGIEHIVYDDGLASQQSQQPQQLDDTIVEDGEGEATDSSVTTPSRATARHSRQSSANRLSTASKSSLSSSLSGGESRVLEDVDGNTRSNRSSATIRPIPPPNFGSGNANGNTNGTTGGTTNGNTNGSTNGNTNGNNILGLNGFGGGEGIGFDGFPADFDFDKALLKFAAERENFLDDLSFSAGAKIQSRPPMVNPRTEKLRAEDADLSGRKSPLKSIRGSIRRKMSFRDMSSVRKQPMPPRAGMYQDRLPCLPRWPFLRTRPRLLTVVSSSFRSDRKAPEQLQLGYSPS